MTKSLVTGGCGFIGSHLVELLLNEGHEVIVLDNLSTGRLSNLDHIVYKENLKIVQGDVLDKKLVNQCLDGCDFVFHLAALADIVPSIVNPSEYFTANVSGTVALLEVAKNHKLKKFVYAASSSCYGIPDAFPTPETAEIRPQYPYAFTKWAGEQAALHWGKVYKLPVVSLRLFNVYGPRSRTSGTYGAVFGVFLAQKLAKKPFTIVGDGSQTRDFTFVTDVAKAFLAAAKCDLIDSVFNVGSKSTYSVNYLAQLLGGDSTYIPKRPGEPDCTFADISKIERELNWNPVVKFEDGINKMLENIDYWTEAPVWDQRSIRVATKEWFALLESREE
jgi:UDP-glucose 4-epimerase